jgi:hypothetical protein
VLGGIVGASELIGRYRDAPNAALRTFPARFYVTINIIASIVALFLIRHYGPPMQSRTTQVLIAGISAMAFFRTSLFLIRVGDRDIGVGPSAFFQIFLDAADRSVDRIRASARSGSVGKIMEGIDYTKAFQALPPYCLALMQNLRRTIRSALRMP